jgi:hypothetical protein
MSNLSPAPGVPQTGTKAKYAGVVSAGLTFVGAVLAYWIADADPFTAKEFGEAVLTGAVAAGVIGGGTGVATYNAQNKPV